MQRELAKRYMGIGVFMSAFELLKQVGLWEDCITCLFSAGRTSQAEQMAQEKLAKKRTPQILCLLGDIKRDPKFYKEAWEVSGQKSARAMRSLARNHFYRGEFKEAIECYTKALAISRLYPESWYALGCAHMRLEEWKDAIFAFGVAISIDEGQAEAWANVAACYMQQNKYKEAILSCEQALKQNRNNWKIWENLIIFSLHCKLFSKAVTGIRELLRKD